MHRFLLLSVFVAACTPAEEPAEHPVSCADPHVVELTIGEQTFSWADPADGGAPIVDAITVAADASLDVAVRYLDSLDNPEDVTAELVPEEHQVFFGGEGIYRYDDADRMGLSVGLEGFLLTPAAGSGELVVRLQHLASTDKYDGLEDVYTTTGAGALPGTLDLEAVFDITFE